ncbi:MAG: beta-propeller fold lactonase family protein [Proteobacteria bacterium]|nr:beta-propeller fold lactonase family protein [Pseudomonadota bacterium]
MNSAFIAALALVLGASTLARADQVIVLNSEEASYSVLSRSQRAEVQRLPLGREPHHLIQTPDGKEVLIASTVTNELVALDTKTGERKRTIPGIVDAYQLGFSPDGKWFVTASYRLDHVDIYRYDGTTFTLANRTFTGGMPSHLTFGTDSKTVFVSLQQSSRVVAFDLATQAIKWNMEVGKVPAGLVMLPDNKRLLVALTGEDAVVMLDPATGIMTGRLQTGRGAHNFWPKGDGRYWFLSNRVEGTISLIDTQEMKVDSTVRVPGGPDCMDITPDGKELWVTQRFLRRIAILDLATLKLTGSIPVGKSPHGVFILKTPVMPMRAAAND